jgi:hypothetical protein
MVLFQALSSRRFQHRFHRVNLHRLTLYGESSSSSVFTGPNRANDQGLTLVPFSAQPEPFLKRKHILHIPSYPLIPHKQPLNNPQTRPLSHRKRLR